MMFAKKLIQFVDKPHKVGGNGPDGFDCVGLVVRIQEAIGKKVPHGVGDWNEFNYGELYTKDRALGEEVLIKFLDSFAESIPVNRLLAGDIIVLRFKKDNEKMPGVYVGNGNFISSFTDGGVRVFSLNNDKFEVIGAWRVK